MSGQPPYNAYAAYQPYRSAHSRAQIVVVLLTIGAIIHFLSLLTSALGFFFPSSQGVEEVSSNPIVLMMALLKIGLGLFQFLVYIATVVVFLMWLYRSYENLRAFGVPPHEIKYSSGWAVGSFFVPFVSLVVPYRAVRELWRKSQPPSPLSFGDMGPPPYFPLWWTFWIVSNIANQIYFRLTFEGQMSTEVADIFSIVTDLVEIPAALLAIMVVREIDRRQTETSKLVNVQFPNPPPPPPSFQPVPGQ